MIGTSAEDASRRPYLSSMFIDAEHRRHEQRGLGPEVVLQVGVEVQVILRQVGEHRHVEAGAPDPAQGQRVAGHLHRGGGHPALGHDREQGLQVGRLRGGQRAGQPVPADPGLHPADQAGLVAGGAQPGLQQVGRGGLAAGPGHADEPQPARRVPVHPAGDLAQLAARIGEHEDRYPGWPRRGPGRPGRSAPPRRPRPPRRRRTRRRGPWSRAARRTGRRAPPRASRA